MGDRLREEARRNTQGGFEQWAKNPTCDANTLLAVHNVRLNKAAEAAGLAASFGHSPLPSPAETASRPTCFVDQAATLRAAVELKDALPGGSFWLPRPAAPVERRQESGVGPHQALTETTAWLLRVAARSPEHMFDTVSG